MVLNLQLNLVDVNAVLISIDMCLKKNATKTLKEKEALLVFKKQKESLLRWNIIKHQKIQYIEFLINLYNESFDSKYSLPHTLNL